jgi:hypothetical protein
MKKALNVLLALSFVITCNAQKQTLILQLTKGQTYMQKTVATSSVNQTISGQEINIKMTITGATAYKVIEIVDTVYDMEVRYEQLALKMALPTGTMEFSSEKNDESDIFSSMLKGMKDVAFQVKMTRTGKILEVKNIDAMFSSMLEKFPQLSEAQKQQFQGQLSQSFGENSFKGSFEMVTSLYTDSPVEKGDTWLVNTALRGAITAGIKTTYELMEVAETYYVIKGTSTIATNPDTPYAETNGMPMKYNLNGTMSSDIKVDIKTGWVITAAITQQMSGEAVVKDNPKIPGGITIPMSFVNEISLTDK